MDKDQRTFRELQKRCTELELKPCRGGGINKESLLKKVWDAEHKQNIKKKEPVAKKQPKSQKKKEPAIKKEPVIKKPSKPQKKEPVPKKTVDKPPKKTGRGQQLSAEEKVKLRDPVYYEEIKNIVPNMPDIRLFQSDIAKKSLGSWNNENKWRALLQDLETLDDAKSRGDQGDIDLITVINLSSQPAPDTERKRINLRSKIRSLAASINNKKAREFVIKYPALTWLLSVTDENMQKFALLGGYDDWMDEVQLTDEQKINLLFYARYYPIIINNILDSIDIKQNYDLISKKYNTWIECKWCHNLVSALLDQNIPISYDKLAYVIVNYPIDLFIKIYESGDYDPNRLVYAAVRADSTEPLKYLLSKGLNLTRYDGDLYYNAIKNNQFDMVKLLAENGTPYDSRTIMYYPPGTAAYYGRIEILDYLLSLPGHDEMEYMFESAGNDDETLLEYSLWKPESAEYILKRFKGRVPKEMQVRLLNRAAWHGNPKTMELVINEFSYTQKQLDNANIIAYTHGNINTAKLLESAGAKKPKNAEDLFVAPV